MPRTPVAQTPRTPVAQTPCTPAAKSRLEKKPCSPTANLFLDRSFDNHIVAIIGLGMPLHSQELERALDPLLENEIFCCIPVEDGALIKKGEHSWVPEEVDIKQHIKWNIGDLVQDEEETGKSFDERCLTKITSVALERSKLLWE
ncbi:hypothetical protein AMTR_s00033p00150450, partial [Amborella trichopoda]